MMRRARKRCPPVDIGVLNQPLDVGPSDVIVLSKGLTEGTAEVRHLLVNECNVILECRVCRGLFRSLANLVAHKRHFCSTSYVDLALPAAEVAEEGLETIKQNLQTSVGNGGGVAPKRRKTVPEIETPSKQKSVPVTNSAVKRSGSERQSKRLSAIQAEASRLAKKDNDFFTESEEEPGDSENEDLYEPSSNEEFVEQTSIEPTVPKKAVAQDAGSKSNGAEGGVLKVDVHLDRFYCFTCEEDLGCSYALRAHLDDHDVEDRFHVCPECDFETEFPSDTLTHLRKEHGYDVKMLNEVRQTVLKKVRYRPRKDWY